MSRTTRSIRTARTPTAFAALVALALVAVVPSAGAGAPTDTFTHVDMVVDDAGLHVTPDHAPAGLFEVTVVDNRSDKSETLSIGSVPPPLHFHEGTQTLTIRTIRNYSLQTPAPSGAPPLGSALLAIEVPQLAAPTERVHRVTVEVRDAGMSTPDREARFEQPHRPEFITPNPPPNDVPWTTVAPGRTDVIVKNLTSVRQTCSVDGAKRVVSPKPGRAARIPAKLVLDGPGTSFQNFYVLTCTGDGVARQFDFWIAG